MGGVSVDSIVKAMAYETDNSTLGWDVVVNYTESALNDALKASYHNDPKGLLKDLTVAIQGVNQDLDPYTVTFDFQLGPPLIQFIGSGIRPACTLTIPVDGGSSKTTTQTLPIPAGGYEIVLSNLEMATMSGSTGRLTPSDKPFVFSPNGDKPAYVTIDILTSSELIVKLNTVNQSHNNKQVDAHKGDIRQKMEDYLTNPQNVSSIQYQLANVDPAKPPPGYVVLHPKSFRFAAYHSEEHPTTLLSLFIQTEDQQRGTVSDLQGSWTGLWIKQYKVPPIPDSHTASIIFRSSLMHDVVIKPAIQAAGMDADSPNFDSGQGLRYKIKTHKKVSRDETSGNPWTTAFNVNLDDDENTLRLLLGQHGKWSSQASGSVTWDYGYNFDWTYTHTDVTVGGGTSDWDEVQHVTVSNHLGKSSSFSGNVTDGTLTMNLNIKNNDWDSPTVTMQNMSTWNQIFGGKPGDAPEWIRDTLPETPSFKLNMGNLYFFLTTNLLMPGTKVITVDTGKGLLIPHDFYVVGNIAAK